MKQPQERTKRLEKMSLVCEALFKMRNFQSSRAIVSAIVSIHLEMLKKNQQITISSSVLNILKPIKEIYEKNAMEYRKLILNSISENIPLIPFIGIHLSDLIYINEAPNFVKDKNLINFLKFKQLKDQIFIINKLQELKYSSKYTSSKILR